MQENISPSQILVILELKSHFGQSADSKGGGVHKAPFQLCIKSLNFFADTLAIVSNLLKQYRFCNVSFQFWSNRIMIVGGVIQYEPEVPYFKHCSSFKIYHI